MLVGQAEAYRFRISGFKASELEIPRARPIIIIARRSLRLVDTLWHPPLTAIIDVHCLVAAKMPPRQPGVIDVDHILRSQPAIPIIRR